MEWKRAPHALHPTRIPWYRTGITYSSPHVATCVCRESGASACGKGGAVAKGSNGEGGVGERASEPGRRGERARVRCSIRSRFRPANGPTMRVCVQSDACAVGHGRHASLS